MAKRCHDLGVLFVNLLQDESRWVRMAAFQALGPFISTFSQPKDVDDEGVSVLAGDGASSNSGDAGKSSSTVAAADDHDPGAIEADQHFNSFYYWRDPVHELDVAEAILLANDCGVKESAEQAKSSSPESSSSAAATLSASELVSNSVEKALEDLMARVELGKNEEEAPVAAAAASSVVGSTPAAGADACQAVGGGEAVHAFDLRRVACQELLSVQQKNAESTNDLSGTRTATAAAATVVSSVTTPPMSLTLPLTTPPQPDLAAGQAAAFQPNLVLPPAYVKSELPTVYSNSFYTYYPSRRRSDGGLDSRPRSYSPFQQNSSCRNFQNIVPQNLMDYYLQMIDPYYIETVDAEITRHCAYSLPAVVCTLGKEHWPLLRDLYGTLASDMQWKVRRTLASSIHEVGAILGPEVVTLDLVHVFDGFIKDLDEVRIGVLKHLSDFLRLLPETDRRNYLPRLADFLKLDNEQNWRFRQELALQLQAVVGLFSPADTAQSILPLAFTLASDRVAAVRIPAFNLVSSLWFRVFPRRQIYCYVCFSLLPR